jgi:2-oxo-4-hydroxy-4-carboxy-5-ureidoimidazoline decarboxylase
LFSTAKSLTQNWDEAALAQALSAHPRIGEKPAGSAAEAALSRQEQGAVNDRDAALARALREGNARYEARFGRVFLIRAKGRSGEEILQALHARLENSDAQEVRAALEQLREITLLRLEGVITNEHTQHPYSRYFDGQTRGGRDGSSATGREDAGHGRDQRPGAHRRVRSLSARGPLSAGGGDRAWFSDTGRETIYPCAQIDFVTGETADEHFHLPFVIAPGGWSTYRGS